MTADRRGTRRDTVEQLMHGWSLEQIVGQLFCISVGHHTDGTYGFADSAEVTGDLIERLHIGGVCSFPVGDDGAQPEVVATQLAALQKRAHTPLVTSIDQEGGLVTRMREPATRWPSAMAQSAAFGLADPAWEGVKSAALRSGLELRAAGVNHVYAPVADVNTEPGNPVIGIRSAGADPSAVANFVTASVRGFHDAGIASCLKHFPGHGATTVDSHVGLPTLTTTAEQWRAAEKIPFAAGITAGVDAIMIGHLRSPGLDPTGLPATFSEAIVTGLLRGELGYVGVIVTDAMDMAGAQMPPDARGRTGAAAACIAALRAGCDQILMPRDVEGCIHAVLGAVDDGELDIAALRASAARIMTLKHRRGLFTAAPAVNVDLARNSRAAQTAIARALTWRDRDMTTVLDPTRPVIVVHDDEPPSVGRGAEDTPAAVASELRAHGFTVEQVRLGDPVPEGTCMLVTRDAWRYPEVAAEVRDLCASRRLDVAVCARSPYDSALLPEELPVLLAYGDIPGVSKAVVNALIAGAALGALPIDLPDPEDPASLRWTRATEPVPVRIRPYESSDREAIGRICVRTGASGADATGQYFDDELLPWIYAYPYVEHAPELCLVVEAGDQVVGYILGVADVEDFIDWWKSSWQHRFAERFPDDPTWSDRERALVRKGLEPDQMRAPWAADVPAELHIDMLPVVQGLGLGRILMQRFRALIAARGVKRIGLGVGGRNTAAVAFYRALGFTVLREHTNDRGETTGYFMWLPAGSGGDDEDA